MHDIRVLSDGWTGVRLLFCLQAGMVLRAQQTGRATLSQHTGSRRLSRLKWGVGLVYWTQSLVALIWKRLLHFFLNSPLASASNATAPRPHCAHGVSWASCAFPRLPASRLPSIMHTSSRARDSTPSETVGKVQLQVKMSIICLCCGCTRAFDTSTAAAKLQTDDREPFSEGPQRRDSPQARFGFQRAAGAKDHRFTALGMTDNYSRAALFFRDWRPYIFLYHSSLFLLLQPTKWFYVLFRQLCELGAELIDVYTHKRPTWAMMSLKH